MKPKVTRWVEIEVSTTDKENHDHIGHLIRPEAIHVHNWFNGTNGTWEAKVPEHVARLVEDYVDSLGRDGA